MESAAEDSDSVVLGSDIVERFRAAGVLLAFAYPYAI